MRCCRARRGGCTTCTARADGARGPTPARRRRRRRRPNPRHPSGWQMRSSSLPRTRVWCAYAQRCRRAAPAALRWAIYPSVYAVHCLPPPPPPPPLVAATGAAGSGGRQWSIHPCMHMPSAYRIRVQTCGWLCGWRSGGLGERASQRGLRRRRRPLAAAAAAHHWHAPCRAAAAGPGAAPQLPRGAGVCCHHCHHCHPGCHRHGLPPLPATTACHHSPMMR
jgi:hypothetical protein